MGFHTFDATKADRLEDEARRFRYCSAEELLGALDPTGDGVVADLGSGTGFYTDLVAPHAGAVYAVDVQKAMHDYYRAKGVPENVDLVTADITDLPFDTAEIDAAFSTMTYHEFASSEALAEISRVVANGSRLAISDWSANGPGEAGPPTNERYTAEDARDLLADHGFTVERATERHETFFVTAIREQEE